MDLRRELGRINKRGYDFYTRSLGEGVIWHEFDSINTRYDTTYDRGGRRYRPGVLIPCLWVIPAEVPFTAMEQGRKLVPSIRAAVSMQTLRDVGMSNPEDFDRHINDCFVFEGTIWDVNEFSIRGRLEGADIIVGIGGTKSYPDEERIFDVMPDSISFDEAKRPMGYPNNKDQNFPEHALPAANTETPVHPLFGQDPLYDDPS